MPMLKMPQDSNPGSSGKPPKSKKISISRGRSSTESDLPPVLFPSTYRGDSESEPLPLSVRSRLHDLFIQIEKEFEAIYAENTLLQEKIDCLNEKLGKELSAVEKTDTTEDNIIPNKAPVKPKSSASQSFQKVKAAHKLKAQTSRIVSSFKAPVVSCSMVREYHGHRDGVWEVTTSHLGQMPVFGTASADHTACIWAMDTGKRVLQYQGHVGSVNSIKFHPNGEMVLTSSGDNTAHIWQVAVPYESLKAHSSEEEVELSEKEDGLDEEHLGSAAILRTPLVELSGHSNVVICADWLPGGDQVITASWDRVAHLYDAQTGEIIQSLIGHDHELTHTSAHPTQRLVVTSSKDTTFRLWDFRDPINAVSVFQGHTESVTCATFTREDKVVSGSDDRSVRVWDLRNMRSPLASMTLDSPVNRISIHPQTNVIALPHDNRNVRLYDINGQRLARLPRNNRMGHRRMVCSVAWSEENSNQRCNLFSCGFDRLVISWLIQPGKDVKD